MEDSLRVGAIQPGEEKAQRRPHSSLPVSKRNKRAGIFTKAFSRRRRGNGFEPKQSSFRLDIRKKIFTVRVVRFFFSLRPHNNLTRCSPLHNPTGKVGILLKKHRI